MFLGSKTIYLGDRKSFLERLDGVLASENAVPTELFSQRIGLVEITRWEVRLRDGVIYTEHDPILGKSLTGPHHLVDWIANLARIEGSGGNFEVTKRQYSRTSRAGAELETVPERSLE